MGEGVQLVVQDGVDIWLVVDRVGTRLEIEHEVLKYLIKSLPVPTISSFTSRNSLPFKVEDSPRVQVGF